MLVAESFFCVVPSGTRISHSPPPPQDMGPKSRCSGVFSAVRYFDRYLLQFGPVSNHDHTSDQVVKPVYNRLNYQEFLYNSIVNTFDSLKMWDMSYIFPATKN